MNSHKLCDEMGHPILILTESQWNNMATIWSKFPNRGKAIAEKILASDERNPNEQDYESHSQGPQ